MISMDMKYTNLYWAIGYVEVEPEIFSKLYSKTKIEIYAEKQFFEMNGLRHYIDTHRSFVLLECLDRLMSNEIYDYIVNNNIIDVNNTKICYYSWGEQHTGKGYEYTSRLNGGLIEYKFYHNNTRIDFYTYNEIFENSICSVNSDFHLTGTTLIRYSGLSDTVIIPEGVTEIACSAFWDNNHIKNVILPNTLEIIGGDAFFKCSSLESVNIPENVKQMGNNPFAGCPNVEVHNHSPHFTCIDDSIYTKDLSRLIYHRIMSKISYKEISKETLYIGKHAFFNCKNIHTFVIPASIVHLENNPFSGCMPEKIINYSPYYHIIDGVIYNKDKTYVIGSISTQLKPIVNVLKSTKYIGRNAFWNCKIVKKIILPNSIQKISYNPFSSTKAVISIVSDSYTSINDGLYSKDMKTLIYCSASDNFVVPESVVHIERSAFSGQTIKSVILPSNLKTIGKSAFSLSLIDDIFIPDSVEEIGEWCFSHCYDLKNISINHNTKLGENIFNNTHADIEYRKNNEQNNN